MGQRSNFQQGSMEMTFDMEKHSKYVKKIFEVIQSH